MVFLMVCAPRRLLVSNAWCGMDGNKSVSLLRPSCH